jgi:hypothetical protein
MSLIQLIKLICEDLIPYYSTHSSTKQVMTYRVADSKVKSDSKLLKDSSFHQPITENLLVHYGFTDNMIFNLGDSTIYRIDISSKSCTCRWNMAYGTCKHIYK